MKKIIHILTFTVVALVSSLTIVSCSEEDIQPQQGAVHSGVERDPIK